MKDKKTKSKPKYLKVKEGTHRAVKGEAGKWGKTIDEMVGTMLRLWQAYNCQEKEVKE